MAADPKLIVALEARLTKFEKQLKEAGVIADKSVKEVEDKFAKANPQFKSTFAGTLFGNLATGAINEFVKLIESIPKRFKDIESAAETTGLTMQKVFAIGAASKDIDAVNVSLEKMAILLDRARRGESNTLTALLDENKIQLSTIKDVADLFLKVADIAKNAANPIRAREIVESAGAVKSLTNYMRQGSDALKQQQDQAEKNAPDLQKLADIAKDFDRQWDAAIMNFKKFFLENIGGVQTRMADFVLQFINLFDAIREAGAGFRKYFGIDEVNLGIIDKIKAAAESLRAAGEANALNRPKIDLYGSGTGKPPPVNTATAKEQLDTVQKFLIAQQKANDVIAAEIDTLFRSNAEKQIAIKLAEAQAAAAKRQEVLTDTEIKQISEKAAANAELTKTLEARKPIADYIREGQAIEKNFANVAVSGLRSFEDALISVANKSATTAEAFKKMAASIIADIGRILVRAAVSNVLSNIFAPGVPVGTIASGAGIVSANPPQFAEGGFLGAGKWGIAGEQGPELIKGPAQIVPNDITSGMGGGQSFSYAPMIDARGADQAAVARLAQIVARQQAEFESRVKQVVRERNGKRW